MKHSPRNIINHELIGLSVEVLESLAESYVGLKGKVIDETYNMLVLETSEGEKKVLKSVSKFLFTLPNGRKVVVDGSILVGRPEERLKKKVRGRW
ncbi:MAG: ribonuclease P protein component 1 [Thermoprotei archaeon]|nr:ribonuclease P protein component 1 [Thermoprotei archaeon]